MKLRYLLPGLVMITAAVGSDLKPEEFSGLRLSLIHETKIETYLLGKNGVALAQFGTKGEEIAAPALKWNIDGAYLVITHGTRPPKRFEVIAKDEKTLRLRRPDGEIAVFEVAKLKE